MQSGISEILGILERLVGFDTSSHKSNAPLVLWVRDYLAANGVDCDLLPDAGGEKFNLLARIGGGSGRGIVLSGHTDVVPADPAAWRSDPFRLDRRGDRVYGRGTTDMKGFLSIVLAAVPAMRSAHLARPIYLAFSHDEEVGCLGAAALAASLPRKQEVIVGEPTSLRPGLRHNGARIQTLTVTGRAAHSGTPGLGVNAIEHAQPALQSLIAIGSTLAQTSSDFPSSLVVTGVRGGGAVNCVPAQCEVTWLFRPSGQPDSARVEAEIARITDRTHGAVTANFHGGGARVSTICDVPAFVVDAADLDAGLLGTIAARDAPAILDFATEAGIFREAGHDVIVCGPGDMAQGHIDDEFIEVSELEAGMGLIAEVLDAARA